jgi:4-diphosphocytidyl-2-C-methyl-D-erythritol kinase
VSVSTPAVYREWDAIGGPTAVGVNDLEPAAIRVAPALAAWRDRIGDASGETPILAGSGATWWVPGERVDAHAALRDAGAEGIAPRAVRAELVNCDVGGGCAGASSCASSCASACDAS